MGYDPNSPFITMGCKIIKITSSPVYLKITRHNKTQDKAEEKYWVEQYMSKEAVQKVLSGKFKEGDEINFTIDKTKHFDGGVQLLTDISQKSNGNGGGYRKPFDPEADKRRQESIERQNARGIAKDILAICFEQYPISAKPDNFEKALVLFPQLMQKVKEGEKILLGGD